MSDICDNYSFSLDLTSNSLTQPLTQQKADHRAHSLSHTRAFDFPKSTLTLRTVVGGRLTFAHRDLSPAFPPLLGTPLCLLACWLSRCLACSCLALAQSPALPCPSLPPPVSSQSPQHSLADCHPTLTLSTTSHHRQSPSLLDSNTNTTHHRTTTRPTLTTRAFPHTPAGPPRSLSTTTEHTVGPPSPTPSPSPQPKPSSLEVNRKHDHHGACSSHRPPRDCTPRAPRCRTPTEPRTTSLTVCRTSAWGTSIVLAARSEAAVSATSTLVRMSKRMSTAQHNTNTHRRHQHHLRRGDCHQA